MKTKILLIAMTLIGINSNIFPQTLFRSGIFLHHSSGGVIWNSSNPDVPQLIDMYNTEHNYTGNNAVTMNIDSDHFPPLPDGNYYDTWHAVFVGQYDPTIVAQMQQYIQNNNIIVIKTCWGAGPTQMGNPNDTLVIDDYNDVRTYYRTKWHWRNIIRVMENYPDNFFAIWTSIPSVPGPGFDGTLAHRFFTWAKDTLATGGDPIFGNFPDNVYVFDAFHILAVETDSITVPNWVAHWGMNPLYHDGSDNHPNEAGADAVAHPFVWETFDAAIYYESNGVTFQLAVPVQNGWNLVSIPGLHPINQSVDTWWTNKDPSSNVFKYNGAYQTISTMIPGSGYMLKHKGEQVYNTGDEWPANGIKAVYHHPVSGETGWNLIGGYDLIVATSGITTTPSGLQLGPVFGYSSNAGYYIADSLFPGFGYWIRLTGPGFINLPDSLEKSIIVSSKFIDENWGKIEITDRTGKQYTLYAISDEVDLNYFYLPPAPEGMIDVRYTSGKFVENINDGIKSIEIRGMEYPIRIRAEDINIKLQDESALIVNEILKTDEDLTIHNPINELLVSSVLKNEEYFLEQNFPNPFNPITTIRYEIPEAGNVKLILYNILGQEIKFIVNEYKTPGIYTINFDGSRLNSGIYIYKFEVNGFIQSRKMILIK